MALLTAEKHTKTNHMPSREIIITLSSQVLARPIRTLAKARTANYTILNFAGIRA